jgi:hypothetical protein
MRILAKPSPAHEIITQGVKMRLESDFWSAKLDELNSQHAAAFIAKRHDLSPSTLNFWSADASPFVETGRGMGQPEPSAKNTVSERRARARQNSQPRRNGRRCCYVASRGVTSWKSFTGQECGPVSLVDCGENRFHSTTPNPHS